MGDLGSYLVAQKLASRTGMRSTQLTNQYEEQLSTRIPPGFSPLLSSRQQQQGQMLREQSELYVHSNQMIQQPPSHLLHRTTIQPSPNVP